MAIIDNVIVFVVSLLIGAAGIYVGGRVLADGEDYTHAVVTALIGAVVWALIGWFPIIGPLIALIAYVAIINWRYSGGWGVAVGIALVAWLASLAILWVLAALNVFAFSALGVPGA